jgi:16S rRNA (uracil1498-N3)-methyltransferase
VRHTFRYLAPGAPEPGQELALSPADSHHLTRVVRRRPGDEVELIDGGGRLWPAVVVEAGPRARVRVSEPRPGPPPSAVSLYQALAEWSRLDMVVEKASELGVEEVTLVVSERVRRVPEPDAWRRRRERLGRVAEAAARQSGQGRLPRVRGLVRFPDVVAEIPTGEGYLIDPRGEASLPSALQARGGAPERVALVVGPDAGFSDGEVADARRGGLAVCRLGPAVLRSETAALVAVALAMAATGGLAGEGA